MTRISDELTISQDDVTLYHTTDTYLGNSPVLVFHGSSTISNCTLNSSRIQLHIFTIAGFQSYHRITISPNLPFYEAVNYLPRDRQGDEVCRGIAFGLLKYFREIPDSVKNILITQYANLQVKHPFPALSLFSERHAANLAGAVIKVENATDVLHNILIALRPQYVNHIDLDLILPPKSIKEIKHSDDSDEKSIDYELEKYGKYDTLIKQFGEITFLPTSRLQRAPSRANSTNRTRSFSVDQKTSLRREMGEFVDTEERYVIKLHELVHHIAKDFREKAKRRTPSSHSPSEEDLEKLFPRSLDKILKINTEFLNAIRNVMDETEEDAMLDLEAPPVTSTNSRNGFNRRVKDPTGALTFVKVLLDWFPQFKDCYQEYIRASQLFPQIITSFVKQQSSFSQRLQIAGEQHLRSAVIEPVQRLPRYSLFIDNIASCLPALHPALQYILKAKDIITTICSMDPPGPESSQVFSRLENLVESWPIDFIPQNRLVTAIDYIELADPSQTDPTLDSQRGIFLIFTDRLVLLRKSSHCSFSARGFLAEIDKPSASYMMANMTATASGNKRTFEICFSGWYMLNEIRFTISDDYRNVHLMPINESSEDFKIWDETMSPIRTFNLQGAYEGKASKFTEEITKARIEARFSESERESYQWSFRSVKPALTDLSLHTAIFEERNDIKKSNRQESAPIRILVDHITNTKMPNSSHYGVEIIANITTIKSGTDYRLKVSGLRDRAFADEVVLDQLLPTLVARIVDLIRNQYSLNNPILTTSYISFYSKILNSTPIQYERDKHRSFMPSSPVKLLANLFNTVPSMSGNRNLKITSKNNSSYITRSDSNKSKLSFDVTDSRTDPRYEIGERPDNHLLRLEETFAAYTTALRVWKGNVVGRALRNHAMTDELAVNAIYNTFIENPYDQRTASEVTVDVLIIAFKKYLRRAWREQMGDVISQQTLDELQMQALRLTSKDFTHYVRLILNEMIPQNRRAFISIVKLLADLLDGCSNDGDQGAITAAFAELLVVEGNCHDYINLLDRLVMDQERLFQAIGTGAIFGGEASDTYVSCHKSNPSAINSIASNTSSFRKRFAETLLRQNSSSEKPSVWRSLNKNSRTTIHSDQKNLNTNLDIPVRRSRSIESSGRRPNLGDRPTVLGVFTERPSSSSGSTIKLNLNGASSSDECLHVRTPKKKRRSSLSDLKSLQHDNNPCPILNFPATSKNQQVTQNTNNLSSTVQSSSKIPLTGALLDRSRSNFCRIGSPILKENLRASSPVRNKTICQTRSSQKNNSTSSLSNSGVILIKDLWTTPSLKKPVSLAPTNIPTLTHLPSSKTNTSRATINHNNIPRPPQKQYNQFTQRLHLPSLQKLRECIHNETKAIQNAEADIHSELTKIGAQIAKFNCSNRIISHSSPEQSSLNSLQLSFSSLVARIPKIMADLIARNEVVETDLERSLQALEFKVKGLDQLYREAAAENELLYERFNGDLTKIVKAVKFKEDSAENVACSVEIKDDKAEKVELVNKIKETTNEIAMVRSENARLKKQVLSLQTLLKVCE